MRALLIATWLACAARPPAPPEVSAAAPLAESVLDFEGAFGAVSSLSLFDVGLLPPGGIQRLLIEPALLDARSEAAVETWSRRLLFARLGRAGVRLIGPAPLPCPPEGCGGETPDTALRAVYFLSGTDDANAVVRRRATGEVAVSLRQFGDEASRCPEDFTLEVGYVEIGATLQRVEDGALIAALHEVALLPGLGETTARAVLPAEDIDPAGFCDAVRRTWDEDRALRKTEARYTAAAEAALEAALGGLLVPQTPPQGSP